MLVTLFESCSLYSQSGKKGIFFAKFVFTIDSYLKNFAEFSFANLGQIPKINSAKISTSMVSFTKIFYFKVVN